MNPERWQKVEALYRGGLECGRQDRAALMARADPELRRDVEALLAQEETAAMETMVDALTQLGPYKIEAPLGAGGMGEVFRARDTRLGRTVAIKILPRDKVADPERKRRFMFGRATIARLSQVRTGFAFGIAGFGVLPNGGCAAGAPFSADPFSAPCWASPRVTTAAISRTAANKRLMGRRILGMDVIPPRSELP